MSVLAEIGPAVRGVAVGLGELIERSEIVFLVIKYVGAAYLIFLGIQAIRAHGAHSREAMPVEAGPLWRTAVQGLVVEAGRIGEPGLVMQAVALDPLTSGCCTLAEVRAMTAEMLAAEAQWLPQFEGKTIRPTPTISIPKDVQRAAVPVDPALKILARFGELGG